MCVCYFLMAFSSVIVFKMTLFCSRLFVGLASFVRFGNPFWVAEFCFFSMGLNSSQLCQEELVSIAPSICANFSFACSDFYCWCIDLWLCSLSCSVEQGRAASGPRSFKLERSLTLFFRLREPVPSHLPSPLLLSETRYFLAGCVGRDCVDALGRLL